MSLPALRRGRGGNVLLLVMLIASALLIGGAVMTSRTTSDLHGRRAGDVRVQALWLARSALDAGVSGHREVATPLGTATVDVTGRTVVVELQGARATVQSQPYEERFDAAGP